MRKILRFFLARPLTWIGNYLSTAPKPVTVFRSLSNLYYSKKDLLLQRLKIIEVEIQKEKFVVFSDQHKGNESWADDFNGGCEKNYIAALTYYNGLNYNFVNLGDSEEMWKFTPQEILKPNAAAFKAEAAFQPLRYYKTFGNHDVIWKNPLDVTLLLKDYFQMPLPVYEGILLQVKDLSAPLEILMTHGHQGDVMSDNNDVSTWIVAHIWMPLQRYLRLNINTPSKDLTLRNRHNKLMHEWSSRKKNLLLITGHTHKPVFASGRYSSHPDNKIDTPEAGGSEKPCYFNTGCCCYNDGDITGIEIDEGCIRLVKWFNEETTPQRMVLEEHKLEDVLKDLAESQQKIPASPLPGRT